MVTNFDNELAEPNKWPVEDEVHLLYSTLDNKPVGIDKHFQMSIIWDRFISSSKKPVNSDILWKKLNSWYNLKSLDESEILPFNNGDEEFKLPSESFPESYLKSLSEDEKKNVDFTGSLKKYVSFTETDDEDDTRSQFKLKGNEKLKWFENSQFKNGDRSRTDSKQKTDDSDSNDSISRKFGEDIENKKVIRQYGKAGEVSSGTIVTLNYPSEHDESFDNMNDTNKEEEGKPTPQTSETKNVNSDKVVKIKRTRSNKFSKIDTSLSSDAESSSTGKSSPKILSINESIATTRSRKASVALQESTPSAEIDKTKSPTRSSNDEIRAGVKRRYSQRNSSTSESKPEQSSKSDSNKVEIKRKSISRR